jgi:transposase
MNLYQTQHPFYCGIDLHAKEMYACVIDQDGEKHLHRNFKTRQPEKLFDQLEPFGSDVIVGCESTFNWYWLCDACEEKKIPFILGHALYLKAIHGGKVKSDKIDSEKLARLLRGGNFAVSYAYPQDWRATRDLLRRRSHFVRRRGETLAHIQIVNHQQNLPAFPKKLQYISNREGIADRFSDPAVAFSIQSDVAILEAYDILIRDLERFLEQSAKVHDANNFYLLKTIPGVGKIIAMTMLYEIHDVKRFPGVGDFLSYARLVRGSHTSAGKSYGSPGKKMGNAYLKWAFSEIVPLFKRESPAVKKYIERIERKHGKARACSNLATKLGRAIYFMLRRGEAFEIEKMLR